MPVPILTYHAANVNGTEYANNDHVALDQDLRILGRLGFRIVPLIGIVRRFLRGATLPERVVALTFDDGTSLDYYDVDHPVYGTVESMYGVLERYYSTLGYLSQPTLHATSFVIVSPQARAEMDRRSLSNLGWYSDEWWRVATESGLLGIANHSWDHNHECVATAPAISCAGTFRVIDNFDLAEHEVAQAARYIRRLSPNESDVLFAYPYGETNSYLCEEYFPRYSSAINVVAAFTTEPAPLTETSSRWALPRFVCGADWSTPDGLVAILEECR